MKSLPTAFLARAQQLLGNAMPAFLDALDTPSPVSIRLNPAKRVGRRPFEDMAEEAVPWCDGAYYLAERPVFTLDPLFHGGVYYVQEASSMFLASILRHILPQRPLRVLDLCAAPGGKSTLLASLLPSGSLLVANEVIRSRALVLRENIIKWGLDNVAVTSADPARFTSLTGMFDLILVDAPCSGEGMFRKDERAIDEWSENNLHLCEERQRRILTDIWPALAPGGYLVYSTCTYNPGENEKMLEWLIESHQATSVPVPHEYPGVVASSTGLRFYPHLVRGEGLFMGVVRKEDGSVRSMKKERCKPAKLPADTTDYLPDLASYVPHVAGATLCLLPARHADFLHLLNATTGLHYACLEIGDELKGQLRPSPALALFSRISYQNRLTLDLPTALSYLRRENLTHESGPGGWLLVTYQNVPLGWAKVASNRLNNYYPKEWRIHTL